MRPLILIPLFLLPLTACMTQRDRTVWEEFKAEISSDNAAAAEATPASSEAVIPPAAAETTPASSEAVTPPAPADEVME